MLQCAKQVKQYKPQRKFQYINTITIIPLIIITPNYKTIIINT